MEEKESTKERRVLENYMNSSIAFENACISCGSPGD